jgi:hypothetical protein
MAFVAQQISKLKLDLPPTAIGKDYILEGDFFQKHQIELDIKSHFWAAGLMADKEERFEFNLLGLTFGLDFKEPALKLLIVGRIRTSNFQGRTGHLQPFLVTDII